jgi:hypothetical protein
MRRMLLLVALVLVLVPVAAAKTPLPAKPQGSGNEPTTGGGIMSGKPFKVVWAAATPDDFGDVAIYLLAKKTACSDLFFAAAPFVKVHVHTEGSPLLIGKPALQDGRDYVQADFHPPGPTYYAIQPGVSIEFTRVDTTKTGVWHGKLTVKRQTSEGHLFSYAGTFAAHWCPND